MDPAAPATRSVESEEIAFFSHYYEDQAYHPLGWRLRLQRELRSLLAAAGGSRLGRVLSVGCGAGEFELMLAPFADHITALDLSPEAIRIAQSAAASAGVRNVRFLCQSSSQLPVEEKYDAVVCLAFLHHVPEPMLPRFLQETSDLLQPGGLFYSQDPNQDGLLRWIGRRVLGKWYDRYHTPDERELVPGETKSMLSQAGFQDVHLRYIDLTLIPATFMLAHRPGWPLHICAAIDSIWCGSPVAYLASGFAAYARKPARDARHGEEIHIAASAKAPQ